MMTVDEIYEAIVDNPAWSEIKEAATGFMIPEPEIGMWTRYEDTSGEIYYAPPGFVAGDLGLDPDDVTEGETYLAIGWRMSAPGYLDATEWTVHEIGETDREINATIAEVLSEIAEDVFDDF